MSATNRGGEREENDFYPTPGYAVRDFLKVWQPPFTGGWLEPCFGDGAIIRAVTEFYGEGRPMPQWTAVELRPECNDLFGLLLPKTIDWHCPQDFLTWQPDRRFSVCITNPPYSLAIEFIEKAMQISNRVAMLLRLNFLGSQKRRDWHKAHPADVYVLSERPKFKWKGSDSCEFAWFVWGEQGGRIQVI